MADEQKPNGAPNRPSQSGTKVKGPSSSKIQRNPASARLEPPPPPGAGAPSSKIQRNPVTTRRTNLAPPPNPEASLKLKKRLVYGTIALIVVLSGLVAFRLIQKYLRSQRPVMDVEALWQAAYTTAEESSKKVYVIESKTWLKGAKLEPADYAAIKAEVPVLTESATKIEELIRTVREKTKGGASQEEQDMVPRVMKIKLWIHDADDLVASEKDPKKPQGLYVPMNRLFQEYTSANAALKAASDAKGDVVQGTDLEARKKLTKELESLVGRFAGLQEELNTLDEYVGDRLNNKDLTARDLKEIGDMRETATLAGQQVQIARKMLLDVKMDDAGGETPKKQDPPKNEPAKQGEPPKKEETPKNEPAKQGEPPKKEETPKKEEAPKPDEQPKKDEAPKKEDAPK